ncbi:phosphoglycerate mutase-like protein [Fomes fomentarius]|nr:phosphoglycerate mutase-like protein [Fomes fomentarius]
MSDSELRSAKISPEAPKRVYSIVTGFFAQDHPDADGKEVGALPLRFGLLDDSPDRWEKFKAHIDELNATAPVGTQHKVFFFSRHGQGIHNVAESKYGTELWDEKWSKEYGDNEMVWGPDPNLIPTGEEQAKAASTAWKTELKHGIPLPQKHYASPLQRALNTFRLTFQEGGFVDRSSLRVTILENLREENGVHTCDKRSPRRVIVDELKYEPPIYSFEDGFTEEDQLWKADTREEKSEVAERAATVFNRIFAQDKETYICITAHSGIINGFLKTMGRPRYSLPTGGVLPLVIEAVDA